MYNWSFGEDQDVTCPLCKETCAGLDWQLDDADAVTGAKVFPCEHVISIPPWRFGPTGSSGKLAFSKIG